MSEPPLPPRKGPPYFGLDLDEWDILEATVDGKRAVARGILEASISLAAIVSEHPLDVQLLSNLHEVAFERLLPELAGHLRGPAPNHLPVNVDFGQHRGTPYEEVPADMEQLAANIENLLEQLDDLQASVSQDELTRDVLTAAAYVHCELIRIHPFPNGNGRVARLSINYFCYRYGLLPIAIERPRGDYIDAIRAWLYYRRIEPFVDLLDGLVEPWPGTD